MLAVREAMERSLRSMGMPTTPAEVSEMEAIVPISASTNILTQDIENMLTQAGKQKIKAKDADAFWDEAVEKHGNPPLHPEQLSYEQAKQLGLTPGRGTKPFTPKK